MKHMLLDMMVAMMPFMMPIVWLGYAAVAVGALLAVGGLVMPGLSQSGGWALLAGRVAAGVGLFFIACEVMGYLLGANPGINFGDSSKFEFNIWPFWMLGAGFLAAGILIGYFSSRQTLRHA